MAPEDGPLPPPHADEVTAARDELCESTGEQPQTGPARQDGLARFTGRDAATVKATAAVSRAELTRAVGDPERAQSEARAELARQRAALEADFASKRAQLEAQLA